MDKKTFTDKAIQGLKPRAERYEVFEEGRPGFGLRVSPQGRKTFIWLYRYQNKPRRISLGAYSPKFGLADAHLKHAEAKKLLDQGVDPGALEQSTKEEERKAPTVTLLAKEYLERYAKPKKRSWEEDQRILAKDILPLWGNRKAKEISRRDVVSLLDTIVDRGAPIQANRTLAVVRRMFNFALERDIVNATPCAAIRAPAAENQRDRVLNEDEIRAFWFGLEKASMSEPIRLALKLQLLTAQRKGEIISAQWPDIDMKAGWWTIPAAKAKNGFNHRVPLSPQAMDLLQHIKLLSADSSWLFPGQKDDGSILATSVDHAIRKNQLIFNIPAFTPHDLRRTAASHMTAKGISRLVVSKILNHVEQGVTAVYDRHSYDKDKRYALDSWGNVLQDYLAIKDVS